MSQKLLDQTPDAELIARFEAFRDQHAFQELVRRHGGMVMATARRILENWHDAEDAFQATFMALAKADLRHQVAVGSWLYQAAIRCAKSIHRNKSVWGEKIRRKMEIVEETTPDPDRDPGGEPIRSILDEEIAKLPAEIRAAIVLCDLEGLTRIEAARRLGIPSPTLSDRVARGRKLLASRLVKRGVIGSAGGFAAYIQSVSKGAAQEVSAELVAETTSKALLFAAGRSAAEIGVSEVIGHIATEVIKSMSYTKFVTIGWIALAMVAIVGPIGTVVGFKFHTATATTVFLDTFDDGDYADGSPVTWTLPAHERGVLDATSGDFILSPVETSGEWVTADALDQHLGDTSIRTQGRVSENGGSLVVTVRTQSVGETEHYFAVVGYYETLGGTMFFAGRGDADSNMNIFKPSSPDIQLPFDVRSEDVVIQLDAIGNKISAWAWRAGEEMPSEPQYFAVDSTYSEGYIRIVLGNTIEGSRTSIATFRYVHVADGPIHLIPEPATTTSDSSHQR